MDVDPDTLERIHALFPDTATVDVDIDEAERIVIGVIHEGIEFAFHLVDLRNI